MPQNLKKGYCWFTHHIIMNGTQAVTATKGYEYADIQESGNWC